MSMIHYLTIGFFDPAAISRRELHPRAVLNAEVLGLVRSFADAGREGVLGGRPLEVTDSAIRCVWYAPAYIDAQPSSRSLRPRAVVWSPA